MSNQELGLYTAKSAMTLYGIPRWRICGCGSLAAEHLPVSEPHISLHSALTSPARKRKHEDLFPDVIKEDPKFLSTNTTEAPCRASGIRGIYNMGATCYMNVILQSFVHNPLLRNFYLGDGHQSSECPYKHCMSCAMDDMFQDFYAQETTTGYSASNILASFWLSKRKAYEELASNKEQDAHEFFQFLTEELHEINGGGRPSPDDDEPNPKRMKNGHEPGCKCIVHQTFYGKLESTITCKVCGAINGSVEPFLDLSLGLENIFVEFAEVFGRRVQEVGGLQLQLQQLRES